MEILGILAAILSAASWACGTLLFDRIGKVMSPAGITFVKGAAGILLMALLAVCLGGFDRIEPMDGLYLALSGIIGIAVGDTLFFKSLQDLGAKMQVLFFMLGQVMTMLLSFLFLGELLSVNEYVGSFALLLGVVIVLWGKQEDHPNKARGILYGLLAIGCFSLSAVIVKYSIHDVDVVSATFYRMSFGTVFILLAGLTSKEIKTWVRPLRDVRLSVLFLANVAYMYDKRRWNVVAGNEFHAYRMRTENDREVKVHNDNVCLPYLFVRYRHGGVRWNFQYKTTQKYPTVLQLLEAVNNSNAIMSVKGNNRLGPAYHHLLSSRLLLTNRDAGTHFVFFSNVELADNYIGARRSLSSTSFVEDGNHRNGEMYSYINTDGYWSAKGLLAYGFPIRPVRSNVNLSTMLEYADIPGFWDKDKLYNKQWDWNSFLTVGSNISEAVDFVIDTNVKYCRRTNMAYNKKNISYWSLSYGVQLKWLITRSIPFVVECGRTNYFGSGLSRFDALIANVSLGYKFLRKRNAEIQLTCHDVFNQDNNFLETTTELYRRSMTTSLLKRHFLLRFTYNFNAL